MKRSIIFIALLGVIAAFSSQFAKAQDYPFVGWQPVQTSILEDGNYEAAVYSYNSSTGHKAKYSLAVTISKDKVIAIHFSNGGSVHIGYNNEGYIYSGGNLSFTQDYQGNIIGASAEVRVRYLNGTTQQFSIEL